MRRVNLDLDVLRRFTLGIELGSLAKAAGLVFGGVGAIFLEELRPLLFDHPPA